MANNFQAGPMSKTFMNLSKTQYYGGDGSVRDTYIYNSNGGFCPQKTACQMEGLGSFVITKSRPSEPLAHIHSKPVKYTNNGGGRDTYISDSAGGLLNIYQPAAQKRTFYNGLRQYPKLDNYAKRGHSHTATYQERGDVFCRSQDHFHKGFRREMRFVQNYQRMLDSRLANPKSLKRIDAAKNGRDEKVFKNSTYEEQKIHQSIFKDQRGTMKSEVAHSAGLQNLDNEVVSHLNNSFSMNFKQYRQDEKPQKVTLVSQLK